MGRNKGICALCGKGTKLTFEHVPPQAAFNEPDVTMYGLMDWLNRDEATGQMSGGQPQPEGTGSISLCQTCNSFLGREYVPAFTAFAEAGREMLQRLENPAPLDAFEGVAVVSATYKAIDRLKVSKQILAMLAVTTGWEVMERHKAIRDFVLEPTARGLPDGYRLFLALSPGPLARMTGLTGILNTQSGAITAVTEFVYPPHGYALTFDGADGYSAGEITSWLGAEPGLATVDIRLIVGFTHTPFAIDLRSKALVKAQAAANREAADSKRKETT